MHCIHVNGCIMNHILCNWNCKAFKDLINIFHWILPWRRKHTKPFPNISKWFKETVTKDWKNKATTVIPLSELGPGCAGGFGPKLQVLPPPFHVSPSSNCWDILEQSKKIQSGDPTDWRGNIVIHRVMPLRRRRTCWSFSCCSFWWQDCAFIYYFWG